MKKKKYNSSILLICVVVLAAIFTTYHTEHDKNATDSQSVEQNTQTASMLSDGNLKIHFIDVGQADSTLIQLPDGKNMLIDAGKNDSGDKVVSYLKSVNVSKIDYLFGTHPHEDHIGGLDDVIYAFDIGKFYMPKVSHNTKTFEDVLKAAKAKGLTVSTAKAGVNVLKTDGLCIDILSPVSAEYESLNNYSAVVKLTYKNNAFLFMADAETEVENQILNDDVKADLIKIGHHGSKTSSSAKFIKAVSPKYAVISVGKDNDYGHPSKATVTTLNKAGVEIYRTDESGTIIAVSDGNNITVQPASDY